MYNVDVSAQNITLEITSYWTHSLWLKQSGRTVAHNLECPFPEIVFQPYFQHNHVTSLVNYMDVLLRHIDEFTRFMWKYVHNNF